MVQSSAVKAKGEKTKNDDSRSTGSSEDISFRNEQSDSQSDDGGPEALMSRENRAVLWMRGLLILVLIIAATTTIILIVRFAGESEQSSFETNFVMIGSKITETMISDTNLRFQMAKGLASTITLAMEITGRTALNLALPSVRWEKITDGLRYKVKVSHVSWNPIIQSDKDRREFEAFAQTTNFTIGANTPCYLCGSPDRTYSNPHQTYDVTGFGPMECGYLETAGRLGNMPPEICVYATGTLAGTCTCAEVPPGTKMVTNLIDVPKEIFKLESGNAVAEPLESGPYHPIWQATSTQVNKQPIMYDQMSEPVRADAIRNMLETTMPIMSEIYTREGDYYEQYGSFVGETAFVMYYPIFEPTNTEIVGSITMEVEMSDFLTGVFPPNSQYVNVVVGNTCGQNYTYTVNPAKNSFVLLGEGDLHDPKYDGMMLSTNFTQFEDMIAFASTNKNQTGLEYCRYRFMVFPTQTLEDEYITNQPMILALIVGIVFAFTSVVFILYDFLVRRRQAKVMATAKRTNDILSTLFPQNVRDRLFEQVEDQADKSMLTNHPSKLKMQSLVSDGATPSPMYKSEPIADLFPSATVLFMDIVNFTAWSSEREPAQVFRLLETIYRAFDEVAKTMGVFKVETVGDSYVAVCGLPKPCENHAVVMALFARHCLRRMSKLTRELEVCLGPSTGDLCARVGLHSGPVTAGVLRGEKARFQLFGDTVNTAARMEGSSAAGRIHCSKQTMKLILDAGKEDWIEPRQERITLKGKGEMETYWLNPKVSGDSVVSLSATCKETDDNDVDLSTSHPGLMDNGKTMRLVNWNVEVLYSLLEKVVMWRNARRLGKYFAPEDVSQAEQLLVSETRENIVIDEMTPILEIPEFELNVLRNLDSVKINPCVKTQLLEFITTIANLYRNVPFHNFEHASHVLMSSGKLMKRIVTPEGIDYQQVGVDEKNKGVAIAKQIHEETYGISSDPLMQFAVVFSALIHDVDHTGLTNAELINMGTPASQAYRQKSVAEQNSVDVAWVVLMDDQYKELRSCIYTNHSELQRFRKLIVNAVMATDIADKELKGWREKRWEDAFSDTASLSLSQLDNNRKATIIFEYIIQASDVAHTMQHWLTYQKFNARLFEERYLAWVNGHAGVNDPSGGWYGGEIWFFDNYIIPLARKLKACGVFGVSYDEFLNYALENRKEWAEKGKEIVAKLLVDCQAKYGNRIKERNSKVEM